jgi:hypothetical protein
MDYELTILFIEELNKIRLSKNYDMEQAIKNVEELENLLNMKFIKIEDIEYSKNDGMEDVIINDIKCRRFKRKTAEVKHPYIDYDEYADNHKYQHLNLDKNQVRTLKQKMMTLLNKYLNYFGNKKLSYKSDFYGIKFIKNR